MSTMTRQMVTETDEYGETTTVGWFDRARAVYWDEGTRWDGENMISAHGIGPHGHQRLYRTAGGRWVVNTWSRWQGAPETWEFLAANAARKWLLVAGEEDAVAEYWPNTPEEAEVGRPAIGPQVVVRMPVDLRDRIDACADAEGVPRAEWVRRVLEEAVE